MAVLSAAALGVLLLGCGALALSGGYAGAVGWQKQHAVADGPDVSWQAGDVEQHAWLALDSAAVVADDSGADLTVRKLGAAPAGRAELGVELRRLQSAVGREVSASTPPGAAPAAPAADGTVGAVLYQGERRRENRLVTLGDVIVRFKAGMPAAGKAALAGRLDLDRRQTFPFAANTVLYRAAAPLEAFTALTALEASPLVEWAAPSFLRSRATRALPDDPLFPTQWHLRNVGQNGGKPGEDIGVAPVWDEAVAGLPVRGTHSDGFGDDDQVIAIADDGLEIAHPDLAPNVIPGRSYDWVDGNLDPSPSRDAADYERHGTACAGVAAARGYNSVGVTGSAPWAGLVGYRFLVDGVDSDITEAEALAAVRPDPLNRDLVDVSSNSWGPEDNRHLEAPGPLTQAALLDGVTNGRGGKGIVYVWAAGNGRAEQDNVNYDGYANSRYTLAVGATTALGKIAPYSEDGAPLRVVAPSSDGGTNALRDIVTVDLSGSAGYSGGDYYSGFGGTSAASPMVSGIIALMLQVNPQLTWRDVQAIISTTAAKIDSGNKDWTTNAAGYHVNHTYGFGRVDAAAAVAAASSWQLLPAETTVEATANPGVAIPDGSSTGVTSAITLGQDQPRLILEYVEVVIDAPHPFWHDLEVTLIAPSGTESLLSPSATPSGSTGGADFQGWRFGSARHLGESSMGTWRLRVRDLQHGDVGSLDSWALRLYGTVADPDTQAPETRVVPARQWWNGPVRLELKATDPGSNVARTELRLAPRADGPFKSGSKLDLRVARRTHVDDGRRVLWFRSTDNAGNGEALKRFVVNIDTRKPITRMLGNVLVRRGGVAVLHSRTTDPGFSAHRIHLRLQIENASGRVVKSIDAGQRQTGQRVTVRLRCTLAKGSYVVRALARDLAGNIQRKAGRASLVVR
jgi:subtilisin-like proprotein convertase family protein